MLTYYAAPPTSIKGDAAVWHASGSWGVSTEEEKNKAKDEALNSLDYTWLCWKEALIKNHSILPSIRKLKFSKYVSRMEGAFGFWYYNSRK